MAGRALITGASKRVGKAVAQYLAETGWDIVLHYNSSQKPALELQKELAKDFPEQEFSVIRANLSDLKEVETLTEKAVRQVGNFNLLVNNASVFTPGYLAGTSLELLENQINVNLKAPFVLMRDFARICKKGNIINFVDTRITTNKANFAAYSLSKKGLWELTKMAALEFAPEIRVNAIAPGAVLPPAGEGDDYLARLAEKTPMKKPAGIVSVLLNVEYILENQLLTGQILFADGGENLGQKE